MKILGIETSCDETAVCSIEAETERRTGAAKIAVLAENTLSQIALHRPFGGVYPSLAKREHAKNLVPLAEKTLGEAGLLVERRGRSEPDPSFEKKLHAELVREPELANALIPFLARFEKPGIEKIAVTAGPGLEPALWTGINFARSLGAAWNIPVAPVNHMEGHILVSLLKRERSKETRVPEYRLPPPEFPALALLISGGHTELVLMKDWLKYEIVGETLDDAAGEAFDKAARMLGLPYPGGPEISRLAEESRTGKPGYAPRWNLPRPMMCSAGFDFSFSGLKTAVLYAIKKHGRLSETDKKELAREFEDAVTEVLLAKVKRAIVAFGVKTLILGGGVAANAHIRRSFERLAGGSDKLSLRVPEAGHTTDNALMIALAGYFEGSASLKKSSPDEIRADGNLKLGRKRAPSDAARVNPADPQSGTPSA